MPDFSLQVYGATVRPWIDDPTVALPSRLNPREGKTMLRLVCDVGATVVLMAVVAGFVGPPDSELDGRLFVCAHAEAPYQEPTLFVEPGGRSSVQQFVASVAGHYVVYMRRPSGGMMFVHVDAEVPA